MFGKKKKKEEEQTTAESSEVSAYGTQWSEAMYGPWDKICDWVETKGGRVGGWISKTVLRRLSIEAPVIIGYVFLCVILHVLNMTIAPGISFFLGVDDYFKWRRPIAWVRLFTHIFPHDGLPHLRGNMTHLLLVGPSAEAAFGSMELVQIMVSVALSSALAHILIGKKNTRQLGASGVCFALILLNSLVSAKHGKVPVSFLLTAFLWIGDEIIRFFFSGDGVSHHAHLTGAIVGTIAGYMLHRQKEKEKLKKITKAWLDSTKKKE